MFTLLKRILPILGLLLFSTPAWATWSLIHTSANADITSSGSTSTITGTPSAGNLLVAFYADRSSATFSVTSVTGACTGSWVVPAGAHSTNATGARAQQLAYCLNAAASTTVTTNYTGASDTVTPSFTEYHSTVGNFFDLAAGSTNLSCVSTTCTGPSVTTTGSNDMIVTYFSSNTNTPTATAGPFTFELGSSFTDNHGNPLAHALNQAASSYAPVWTEGTDNTANNTVIAFSESAGGTAASKLAGPAVIH